MFTTLTSGCKINLWLRIVGKRADGMHELDTLFFPLSQPQDRLVLQREGSDFVLEDVQFQPEIKPVEIDPKQNTLLKAWNLFGLASGFALGLRARLTKGVPAGAGLGGGSADAAALLQWLNTQAATYGKSLNAEKLADIALKVGADVPFFLLNRPCLAKGVGEILTPCDPIHDFGLAGYSLVVVCPNISISTPEAYAKFDAWQRSKHLTKNQKMATENCSFSKTALRKLCENSFEEPMVQEWSELGAIKTLLLGKGAEVALLSGSGSAMFALFQRSGDAQNALESLRNLGMAVFCRSL